MLFSHTPTAFPSHPLPIQGVQALKHHLCNGQEAKASPHRVMVCWGCPQAVGILHTRADGVFVTWSSIFITVIVIVTPRGPWELTRTGMVTTTSQLGMWRKQSAGVFLQGHLWRLSCFRGSCPTPFSPNGPPHHKLCLHWTLVARM